MPYTQADRPLEITTALAKDALLLRGFAGTEAISELFEFHLELLAENEVLFDQVLGEKANIEMRLGNGEKRYFHGIVKSFAQLVKNDVFHRYRAKLVPHHWLLTKRVRSRIFQHISIPNILRKVLEGFDVEYDLHGAYHERDFCVQYRESDFAFISRLMEDEGIYYFFKHSDGAHQMVIRDKSNQHTPIRSEEALVKWGDEQIGKFDEWRVWAWEKRQELRSAEYTLWDHCFELPGNALEAKEHSIKTVAVGPVNHKLELAANRELEIYEFPGGYAGRFDGVDKGGAPRPADIQKIFADRTRTARLRMEAEECAGLLIAGAGNCALFSGGRKFSIEGHAFGDGGYVLTRVEHEAAIGNYENQDGSDFTYSNRFACIPEALEYRPQRTTPKPLVSGVQTATVAGPHGEEMFTDKYGRVKVHFHWDREGKKDANSSCWLRVAQVWAGNGWGAFFWPRIGHEVVVAFENGDPDQPLIVGSVYNKDNMPPFEMPVNQQRGGMKSASMRGMPNQNYNAIVFHDEKGNEHLAIHSERHMIFNAEMDKRFRAGRSHGERVPQARTLSIGGALPISGGSGGGSAPTNILPQPQPSPQGILGVNSAVVYGVNYQVAIPLNVQVALGSNLQLCVNPSSFSSIFTDTASMPMEAKAAQLLGSGMGGNMQCTLGTSANLVIGQSFDINVGPRRIVVDCHNDTGKEPTPIQVVTIQYAIAIQIATAVFAIAYIIPSDEERRLLMMAYQLCMQIVLEGILNFHDLYQDQKKLEHSLYDQTFLTVFPDPPPKPDCPVPEMPAIVPILVQFLALGQPDGTSPLPTLESQNPGLASVCQTLAILEVLILEFILEIAGGAIPT